MDGFSPSLHSIIFALYWNLFFLIFEVFFNLTHFYWKCFAVGWYLANDMQFYVVTPLILWAMYRLVNFHFLFFLFLNLNENFVFEFYFNFLKILFLFKSLMQKVNFVIFFFPFKYRFKMFGIVLTSSVLMLEYILANGLLLHYKDASPLFITKDMQ